LNKPEGSARQLEECDITDYATKLTSNIAAAVAAATNTKVVWYWSHVL